MAFHDISLPYDFAKGAKGGPLFHTTVLPLSGGREKRNIDWEDARATFTVGYGLRSIILVQQLLDFFYGRRGKGHTFRMRHWADFDVPFVGRTPQVIGTGDGSSHTFQAIKTYGDSAGTYERILSKLVNDGSIRAAVNGVEKTEGSDYTVAYATGILTFASAPSAGQEVTLIAARFDNHVRFDTDICEVTQEQVLSGAWDGIPLVEVP